MKTAEKTLLRSRAVARAAHVQHLKAVLSSPKSQIYADTSFLIAGGSLNKDARNELFGWLKKLDARFRVPAWVAHELYGKINSETSALTPMQGRATEVINSLKLLQWEARRFVDQDRIATFQEDSKSRLPKDRVGFLANLDHEVGVLLKRVKHLSHVGGQSLDEAAEALVDLVGARVLNSDIYSSLHEVESLHAARLVGKHPPGFADRKKDDNRYGDLIIWREIVEATRRLRADDDTDAVILLTNDNKPDWIYTPQALTPEVGGKGTRTNEVDEGFKVFFPLPLLIHEIRQARPECDFHIINMPMVAHLLHDKTGSAFAHLYSAYQTASGAPALPEGQDSEEKIPSEVLSLDPALIVQELAEMSPERAAAAVPGARKFLSETQPGPELTAVIRAVMESSDRSVEPASLLVRDLLANRVGRNRAAVLEAMFESLYFDGRQRLRNVPLHEPLDDVFALQTDGDARAAVDNLQKKIGSALTRFLVLPDVRPQLADLAVASELTPAGRLLLGILNGEQPLTEDASPGSARSLTTIMGAASGTVEQLQDSLAHYFRIPRTQLEMNMPRSERLSWDERGGSGNLDRGMSGFSA